MSGFESDPIREPDDLIDPARLAAAWQLGRERARAELAEPAAIWAPGAVDDPGPGGAVTAGPDATASAPGAVDTAATPARAAPLPVARAHREFLDELERTLVASPKLAARAGPVLVEARARLAAAIDALGAPHGAPLAAVAAAERVAERVIDDLEDLLQAVLSAAGWPASGEE